FRYLRRLWRPARRPSIAESSRGESLCRCWRRWYRMVIRSHRADDARRLTDTLARREEVSEFRLSPTGD
ncbi:MAG: hypothetical protein WCA12_16400, partial [Burkholderiales bacterium]